MFKTKKCTIKLNEDQLSIFSILWFIIGSALTKLPGCMIVLVTWHKAFSVYADHLISTTSKLVLNKLLNYLKNPSNNLQKHNLKNKKNTINKGTGWHKYFEKVALLMSRFMLT